MLVLGDVHAEEQANRETLLAVYEATDAAHALQVGDLECYDLPVPTWFVAGNNEDLDVVDALRAGETPEAVANAHLLASTVVELEGVRVGGLSGNYAPTQYEKARGDLEGDRRRHFVREEVEWATELADVDVFLAHEAPHGLLQRGGHDAGCAHVDTILEALAPDLCLVGHHHEHATSTFGPTTVVALAPVWERYYHLDTETLALDWNPAP